VPERTFIEGPAGRLEVVVAEPDRARRGIALIAHPHPLYGGTLDNKVVQTLAKSFLALDYAAVRFNFRGVGESQGIFGDGHGEVEDFLAVAAHARKRFTEGKLLLAGFSFGGYVAAECARTLRPDGLALVAPAVDRFTVPGVPAGTLVLHGEQDDVVPLTDVLAWARPQQLPIVVFPDTGHFFHGMLIPLQNAVIRYFNA
jgi:uncharacterized protein